ncbi:Putative fluoride ion transporter CrcB [Roseimaritima multifibrata]|uniref:Fluoride-specific ion channel FluC n=1 Tax=Roseimaritima multifibrata TaxID=1930274 RepID=A0A517MEU7_9BACT|nr:CrcB family protein [Roseimaritima multifibrata]QDS93410.1 Putative fluoride ion transporter CrcB [Roseimaritima multifibrata]
MPRPGLFADLLAVGLGGAIGAVLRHGLTVMLPALPGGKAMLGTLVANAIGCFAIGLLGEWVALEASQLSERQVLLLRVGLLGGLTTFSTFAAESWAMGGEGRPHWLMMHTAAHLVVGFFAFWLGSYIVRELAS